MHLPFFDDRRTSKAGMSLIEMVMAMGLVGGIVMAMLSVNELQQKTIKANRLIASRDNLKNSLERYLIDPAVIAKSAEYRGTNDRGNWALHYCLKGEAVGMIPAHGCANPPNCCRTNTDAIGPQPFNLVDPADPAGKAIFAGTKEAAAPLEVTLNAPSRYTTEGVPCTTPSKECNLEVVTTFKATCPNNEAECKIASKITFDYVIKQADGSGGVQTRLKTQSAGRAISSELAKIQSELTQAAPSGATGGTGSGSGSGASVPLADDAIIVKVFDQAGPGSFTVPSGVTQVFVTLVGGGGGGGGSSCNTTSNCWALAGGGGAGSIVLQSLMLVKPNETLTFNVGAGGAPGAADWRNSGSVAGQTGRAGEDTTFMGLLTALGGKGGVALVSRRSSYMVYTGCGHPGGQGGNCAAAPSNGTQIGGRIRSISCTNGVAGNKGGSEGLGTGAPPPIPNIPGYPNAIGKGGEGGNCSGRAATSGSNGAVLIEYLDPTKAN